MAKDVTMAAAAPGVVEKACATCGSSGSQTRMFTELAKAAVERSTMVRRGICGRLATSAGALSFNGRLRSGAARAGSAGVQQWNGKRRTARHGARVSRHKPQVEGRPRRATPAAALTLGPGLRAGLMVCKHERPGPRVRAEHGSAVTPG
jgi:hypothetical protein